MITKIKNLYTLLQLDSVILFLCNNSCLMQAANARSCKFTNSEGETKLFFFDGALYSYLFYYSFPVLPVFCRLLQGVLGVSG